MMVRLNKKIEQKNKDDFKPLLYIVITLVATMITCLMLMSFKASALTFTQEVDFVTNWNVSPYIQTTGNCNFNNSSQPPYMYNNGTGPCSNRVSIQNIAGIGFNKNYIFEIDLYYYELRDREPINAYANSNQFLTLMVNNQATLGSDFMGCDYKQLSDSSGMSSCYFRFNVEGRYVIPNGAYFTYGNTMGLQPNEYMMTSMTMPIWTIASNTIQIDNTAVINAINELKSTNEAWLTVQTQRLDSILALLNQIKQDGGASQLDNAEQRTQEVADENQQAIDQAEGENDQASQSLLNVAGSVIGAFNTPASNCKIPVVASGVDLGLVDFCSGKPAIWGTLVGGATSIILVYACYKSAVSMFRLWIKLTSFAQGGGYFKQEID